jgi:hypothetical protein
MSGRGETQKNRWRRRFVGCLSVAANAKFSFRSNAVLGGFGPGDRADDHARAADALSVF